MAVENRIVKVQKRNRALVKFDDTRIRRAILGQRSPLAGSARISCPASMTRFSRRTARTRTSRSSWRMPWWSAELGPTSPDRQFSPTIETIQDEVLHALRSYGFQNTADAYACYRWGRHWLREGAIAPDKFVGNGFPKEQMEKTLAWNRKHGLRHRGRSERNHARRSDQAAGGRIAGGFTSSRWTRLRPK